MFNDILPESYNVEYKETIPESNDYMIAFNGKEFLLKNTERGFSFPVCSDCGTSFQCRYLFSVGNRNYFLYTESDYPSDSLFFWAGSDFFRLKRLPKAINFAGITAFHIIKWYRANRYCGVCGAEMLHSDKERMLYCPECGNMVYPKISPAVILAIHDGERLLMSKYKNRKNARYVLLAGFVEVGETLEHAAMREAFEETGIHIKNLRYYRSQPWGLTDTLLAGFYAELDGDSEITVEENELAEAKWIPRDEIECTFDDFSLTNDMIWHFKQGDLGI